MKLYAGIFVAALCLAAFLVVDVATSRDSTPTPTHIVNVFLDGYNHGDFRQACTSVRNGDTNCIKYYSSIAAQGIFYGVWGGYQVIPHSYQGWREGSTEVASVKFRYLPNKISAALIARLVKTKHGWKIAAIR